MTDVQKEAQVQNRIGIAETFRNSTKNNLQISYLLQKHVLTFEPVRKFENKILTKHGRWSMVAKRIIKKKIGFFIALLN